MKKHHYLSVIKHRLIIILLLLSGSTFAQGLASVYPGASVRELSQRDDKKESYRPLKEVLKKLESNFGVFFTYKKSIEDKLVKSPKSSISIEKSLSEILEEHNLKFKKIDNNYFIYSDESGDLKEVKSKSSEALTDTPDGNLTVNNGTALPYIQSIRSTIERRDLTIKGKVTNDEGEPLPGVSVSVKGTTLGTITDAEGNYTLTVPDGNAILVFSYVGMTTEEVAINNRSSVDLKMAQDVESLQEVVVVGYGTQKRGDITGAISSVKSEDIQKLPATDIGQAIQGRAAGVSVTNVSGRPGSGVSIQIRGVGSINNTEPLYVIDGMITGAGNTINPADIESIEILKDASAAAIYGANAANGVVLITTKRGSSGKPKINLSAYYGTQTAWRLPKMLNARQLAELINEGHANDGKQGDVPPVYSNPASFGEGTDYIQAIFRTAPIRNIDLSIAGGGESSNYLVSGNWQKQDGIIIDNFFERFSLRVNSDTRLGRFKFGETAMFSRTIDNNIDNNPVDWAQKINPAFPIFDANADGGFGGGPSEFQNDAINPVGWEALHENMGYNNRFLGSLYGEVKIIEGLTLRSQFGADLTAGRDRTYSPTYRMGGYISQADARLDEKSRNGQLLSWTNTLNYAKTIGKHDFTLLGGYEWRDSDYRDFNVTGVKFPTNGISVIGASIEKNGGGGVYQWAFVSLFGRLNYSFANKYLFQANIRRDGSSRFPKNNRYGVFPSVSAGWRISEEAFMDNIPLVSELKLTGSYGELGNSLIGDYGYFSVLNASQNYILGPGQGLVGGVTPTSFGNAGLQWETVQMTNIGLDLGLFNNSLMFNAAYYIKKSSDMLINIPIPKSSGFSGDPAFNAGDVENKGLELALSYTKNAGDLTYSIGGNAGFVKNKVTALGSGEPINKGGWGPAGVQAATRTEVGHPIGSFYGYIMDGIFQSAEEISEANALDGDATTKYQDKAQPGDIKWRDISGVGTDGKPNGVPDGRITDADRTYIGNPIPKMTYGINGKIDYKGIDFSLFFQGVQGVDVFNVQRYWQEGMNRLFNASEETLNRWTPTNRSNSFPRATTLDENENAKKVSTRWIENGSYLRLKNIMLGYTLPSSLTSKLTGLASVRIYVSSTNLLTFTKYKGYDPEFTTGDNNNQPNAHRGLDQNVYPQPRTILGGIQIGF